MSMTRTQLALVVLLVLQVALIAAFSWPGTGTTARTEARPWLAGLDVDRVAEIVIEDDQERSVRLASADGSWSLPAFDGFPVEEGRVRALLDQLAEIRVRAPVVQHEKFHSSLEVSEDGFRRHVTISTADEQEPMVEFYLGTSPQYQIHHARRAADDAVYEVTGLSTADLRAEPAEWARRTVVDVDPAQLRRIELTNEHGAFVLERRGAEDPWRVVEPAAARETALDQETVEQLADRLSGLRAAKPVGAIDEEEHGLVSPAARITLVIEEPPASDEEGEPTGEPTRREVSVRIGASHADEESQRYLTASTLDHTVTVWNSGIQRVMDAKLEELAEEEE